MEAPMSTSGKPTRSLHWEQRIRLHTNLLHHCIQTENFAFIHTRHAISQHDAIDYSSQVDDSKEIKEIIEMNEATAYGTQEAFTEFRAQTEDLKNQKPDKADWEAAILANGEKMKTRVNEGIDANSQVAIETIRAMPESAREPATNVYLQATDFIANTIESMITQIKVVYDLVVDFLKGIWDGIVKAYNVVKDAVVSAVDAIKNLFSLSRTSASQLPHITYAGCLNWPSSVAFMNASLALTFVVNHLADKGYGVVQQTVNVEEESEKKIVTVTVFGPLRPTRAAKSITANDLRNVWIEAVRDLGKDEHYIPQD